MFTAKLRERSIDSHIPTPCTCPLLTMRSPIFDFLSSLLIFILRKVRLLCLTITFCLPPNPTPRPASYTYTWKTGICVSYLIECLSVWNTKFQTLQTSKELPQGTSGQVSFFHFGFFFLLFFFIFVFAR